MSKLSKHEKKKIYDKYLAELEYEKNNPYKLLHDFNIADRLIDNNSIVFTSDESGSTVCKNNLFRIEEDRSDGDIRNQSDFVVRIYDNDLLLISLYYTYSIEDRTVDCRKIPMYYIKDDAYNINELIIVALSYLEKLHYCKVGVS
jgi:hypothetical protein